MEEQRPLSNEAEFEYWLVSAFESERKRLRERAPVRDSKPTAGSDRKVTSITRGKKNET